MKPKHTMATCFIGYCCSAVINNFPPLLFLTFRDEFSIPLEQIGLLITLNFAVQLLVDLTASRFVDKIGYRANAVVSHIMLALGLIGLAVLPDLFSDAYIGLIISVLLYAVGGGLLEVIVSPIVESCPTENKSAEMGLLHSFYCWGTVAAILLSTLFFSVFGKENWRILCLLWAVIPVANALFFTKVPLYSLTKDEEGMTGSQLAKKKVFWICLLLMFTAGASELAMSQWASAFAESGLNVSKTVGDLLGPCFFSVTMGISRVIWSKRGNIESLSKTLTVSCVLCVASYLIAALSPWPLVSLIGCGLCGFSVGVFWPGVLSMASSRFPKGGTTLFALLAFGGDVGCCLGPFAVNLLSASLGDNLKTGIILGGLFPLIMLFILPFIQKKKG